MFAPFSSFSRPPIPDFNQDFVNGPIWADALHRMHYVERDGLGELQQQVHQQLGEQWRMLQQLSQWVQDSSSQLCLLAMSLQAPSSFPSFPSSFSSSGSSTTVHPDESPPQMRPVNQTNQMGHVNLMNQAHLMNQANQQSPTHHMRQPVRFNPQTSPIPAQSATCAPNQTIALRARVAEAAAAVKVTDGLSELDESPNKKRGAALPIREILKATEPVRHLDILTEPVCPLAILTEPVHHLDVPAKSVRHMDVLAEPIIQGRKQPFTEKLSSPSKFAFGRVARISAAALTLAIVTLNAYMVASVIPLDSPSMYVALCAVVIVYVLVLSYTAAFPLRCAWSRRMVVDRAPPAIRWLFGRAALAVDVGAST
ncbi:hypothetical protein IW147_005636 [Coemansia sp. RSA 720]|nr:hypothetical protein IW147_005636 [Coemansia sp. RSA 720]